MRAKDPGKQNCQLFAAGQFGKSLPWVATDLLLFWQLHNRSGLPGSVAGWVLLALNIIGGSSTLALGYGLSKRPINLRPLLALQFIGALSVGMGFLFQFVGDALPLVIFGAVLFRLSYPAEDLPQNILSARLPVDTIDLGRYARARIGSAFLARFLLTALVLVAPAGPRLTSGIWLAIALLSVITGGTLLLVRPPLLSCDASPQTPLQIDRSATGWQIAMLVVVVATLLPVTSRLLLFLPAVDSGIGPRLLFAFCAGAAVGPTFLNCCRRRIGPTKTSVLAVLLAIGSGRLLCQPVGAAWPSTFAAAAALAHGLGFGWFNARLWEEIAAFVRAKGQFQGGHHDGLRFAIVLTGVQLCNAIGALLVGLLIDGVEHANGTAFFFTAVITGLGAVTSAVLLLAIERRNAPAQRG